MTAPVCLAIGSMVDVEQICREARKLADQLGFTRADTEMVVLGVTELATNLVRYASDGTLTLETVRDPRGQTTLGIQVTSTDRGPGIPDMGRAMEDGFSTGGSFGSGLPSVRRLMDTFEMQSSMDGTQIVAGKWPTTRS